MKPTLFTLLIAATSIANLYAQNVTQADLDKIAPYFQEKNWTKVFDLSSEILKSATGDTSIQRASMVYYNFYSASYLLFEDKMSYSKLTKAVKKFEGQKILIPPIQRVWDMAKAKNGIVMLGAVGQGKIVSETGQKLFGLDIRMRSLDEVKEPKPQFYGTIEEISISPPKIKEDTKYWGNGLSIQINDVVLIK